MNHLYIGNGESMSGPTIARNYSDVHQLVEANKSSILEVNADGSIRAQTLKEKIGNLGLRITGKYTATKAEKDAKVAVAIQSLYQKTGRSQDSYFSPQKNKDFDRFFHPQPLQKRSATREVKGGDHNIKLHHAIQQASSVSLKLPAQKLLLDNLSDTFHRLSSQKEFQADSVALENLCFVCKQASLPSKTQVETDASIKTLHEDLKQFGLQLGVGPLKDFDISHGIEAWAAKAAKKN